jgi:hypothetical protein
VGSQDLTIHSATVWARRTYHSLYYCMGLAGLNHLLYYSMGLQDLHNTHFLYYSVESLDLTIHSMNFGMGSQGLTILSTTAWVCRT